MFLGEKEEKEERAKEAKERAAIEEGFRPAEKRSEKLKQGTHPKATTTLLYPAEKGRTVRIDRTVEGVHILRSRVIYCRRIFRTVEEGQVNKWQTVQFCREH